MRWLMPRVKSAIRKIRESQGRNAALNTTNSAANYSTRVLWLSGVEKACQYKAEMFALVNHNEVAVYSVVVFEPLHAALRARGGLPQAYAHAART